MRLQASGSIWHGELDHHKGRFDGIHHSYGFQSLPRKRLCVSLLEVHSAMSMLLTFAISHKCHSFNFCKMLECVNTNWQMTINILLKENLFKGCKNWWPTMTFSICYFSICSVQYQEITFLQNSYHTKVIKFIHVLLKNCISPLATWVYQSPHACTLMLQSREPFFSITLKEIISSSLWHTFAYILCRQCLMCSHRLLIPLLWWPVAGHLRNHQLRGQTLGKPTNPALGCWWR